MDRKGKVPETQEARGGVQGQSKVEKRKKKEKMEEREALNQSGLHPALQQEQGLGVLGGRLDSKNLGVWTKVWVSSGQGGDRAWEPSGAQGQQEGLTELRPWAEGYQSGQAFLAGWGVGASSSCTPTWLSQGLSSHLDPAHCPPMLGSACSGFGHGSCTQKLASDLQTFTLSARALVSTITRPTAWSRKPTTYSQSHCHCPVVSIVPPLPLCHLCSHQPVPASRAQFPPPQEPAQSTAA